MTSIILHRWPWQDSVKHRKQLIENSKDGLHFFLRIQKEALRARFCELIDHRDVPHVFLYGSPHLDNLIRTDTGCGLSDFDRALNGPYIADWMMLWLSVATFVGKWPEDSLINAFIDGYTKAILNKDTPYPVYESLINEAIPEHSPSVSKWLKKLRKQPLPIDDQCLLELLKQYGQYVGKPILNDYQLIEAGCGTGSLGRLHTIAVMQSKQQKQDTVILDIKPALDYRPGTWPHGIYFNHDFNHEGARMIAASILHAPMVTADEGIATLNGKHYWIRRLPHFTIKIKSVDAPLLHTLGTQMGRSHGLSIKAPFNANDIVNHIDKHRDALFMALSNLFNEMREAHANYRMLIV